MATKTISLSEDAYERLRAMKREGESFSDLVRRLTRGVRLSEFHGALSAETAAELEATIATARNERNQRRRERMESIGDALEDGAE